MAAIAETSTSQMNEPYRVLARRYRPDHFADMIGQDALVQTLSHAIESGRIAHAFILTGVRGVGKTTTARIIAKALNCISSDKPTIKPCGVCESCQAISQDRHVDVMEMDAATRTGVDDIREIIEGVQYAPVNARYKIYIIDETHMLSKAAFNALLKTLEEPPARVIFIFATTEIRKVPVTILSRCQRFDLRRLSLEELQSYYQEIAKKEEKEIEEAAAALIANAADGSVRDGLSLLDQAFAMSGEGKITASLVQSMLGLVDHAKLEKLMRFSMEGNLDEALASLRELYSWGADPLTLVQDLLQFTHQASLIKALKKPENELCFISEAFQKEVLAKIDLSLLNRYWQILIKMTAEVQSAFQPIKALEMMLVRLVHLSSLPSAEQAISILRKASSLNSTLSGTAASKNNDELSPSSSTFNVVNPSSAVAQKKTL